MLSHTNTCAHVYICVCMHTHAQTYLCRELFDLDWMCVWDVTGTLKEDHQVSESLAIIDIS